MNNLIHQFNLKGDLLSLSKPIYLKNVLLKDEEEVSTIEKSVKTKLREWYIDINVDFQEFKPTQIIKWNKIKIEYPGLTAWVMGEFKNFIRPDIISIADFIIVRNSAIGISKIKKIDFSNIPIGIPLVLAEIIAEQQKIEDGIMESLFDDLLLKINIWRSNGVKDLFIDIDFNGLLEQVNLIPALRQLKILKQLHIPISARIPSTGYFDQQVGMELLMETLLDLGCILIRADHCNKITQILKQWENRIRIENEYSRK